MVLSLRIELRTKRYKGLVIPLNYKSDYNYYYYYYYKLLTGVIPATWLAPREAFASSHHPHRLAAGRIAGDAIPNIVFS